MGISEWTLKQACFQGYPESAVYVQVPIGSRNPAIHNAYHTLLCPSSLFEPRHRSLKVKRREQTTAPESNIAIEQEAKRRCQQELKGGAKHPSSPAAFELLQEGIDAISIPKQNLTPEVHSGIEWMRANDPSAGSPTETLLRLLLPLSDKVHQTFHCNIQELNIAAV